MDSRNLLEVGELIRIERYRQESLKLSGKFPWTCSDIVNPDNNLAITYPEKLAVLAEEFGEVADIVCKLQANRVEKEKVSVAKLKVELIQVAAVAAAWAESL